MSALRAVPDLTGLDRADTVAALRKTMAGLGAAVPESTGGVDDGYGPGGFVGDGVAGSVDSDVAADEGARSGATATGAGRVPVPAGLAGILDGGLVKGTVTSIDAAGAVVAGILAEVTAAGGHVALVGLPDFSALSILEHGGDLRRVLDVPEPGESPLEVVGLLADGVDVIVVKLERTPPPSAARPVMARLRGSGCALLHVGEGWPGAKAAVASRVTAIHGLGVGHGRIRGVEFHVTARGAGRPERGVRWAVGECPASEAAAAAWDGAGAGGRAHSDTAAPVPLRRVD
ncbi:hypothetical protein [uncultured Corynebacterium sp.]|uniref:hypothetical protein n=1 Tax=uncultured Corynebacterium sp. TaxID=159447 RepID=UPI0025DC5621|nr:hypothetical protein [uncultured Corynebacterium sp.]